MNDDPFFPATVMPDRHWWAALWPNPMAVLRALGITPNMTVLDLCCGNGYFTAPLARLVAGQVYALDIDPTMIEQAQAAVAREGAAAKGWFCADARDLAVHVPEKLDFVLIANTFHGVPDQTALARVIADALTSEGRLAIVNWCPRAREETIVLGAPRGPKTDMRMSPESVCDAVSTAGLVPTNVVELPPYHYGAIFKETKDNRISVSAH